MSNATLPDVRCLMSDDVRCDDVATRRHSRLEFLHDGCRGPFKSGNHRLLELALMAGLSPADINALASEQHMIEFDVMGGGEDINSVKVCDPTA